MLHGILLFILFVPAVMTAVAAVLLTEGENGSIFKRAFMAFWYKYVRQLNILWPSIRVDGKKIVVFPEVYKPLENEHAVVDYMRRGDRVLDLGCGSGVCTVFAAAKAKDVLAVDISPAAVRNTEENVRLHGLKNVVVRYSDMFSGVEGKFDIVLANPPYIALDFKDEQEQFATSVRYLPTLFDQVGEHLTPDGRLLVQFPIWFRRKLKKLGAEHGFELVSVERTPLKGPGLFLLSLAYMQVGFRSAFFLFRRVQDAAPAEAKPAKAAKRVRKEELAAA
jgi:SAM-dependent methyltransferase